MRRSPGVPQAYAVPNASDAQTSTTSLAEGTPPGRPARRPRPSPPSRVSPGQSLLRTNQVPGEPALDKGYAPPTDRAEAEPHISRLNTEHGNLLALPLRHKYSYLHSVSRASPPALNVQPLVQQCPVGLKGVVAGSKSVERLTKEAWWTHDKGAQPGRAANTTPEIIAAENPATGFIYTPAVELQTHMQKKQQDLRTAVHLKTEDWVPPLQAVQVRRPAVNGLVARADTQRCG